MGSLLSIGTKRRQTPAWCKPGMWGVFPPLIAGMPVRLAVFARWHQKIYGVDIDLIESFQLYYHAVNKDWSGASGDKGDNLHVEIATLDLADHYDVQLSLRESTTIVNHHTWHNVAVPDVRPFDTGLLKYVINDPDWYYQLRAKG